VQNKPRYGWARLDRLGPLYPFRFRHVTHVKPKVRRSGAPWAAPAQLVSRKSSRIQFVSVR
jgi:hypothetical protein